MPSRRSSEQGRHRVYPRRARKPPSADHQAAAAGEAAGAVFGSASLSAGGPPAARARGACDAEIEVAEEQVGEEQPSVAIRQTMPHQPEATAAVPPTGSARLAVDRSQPWTASLLVSATGGCGAEPGDQHRRARQRAPSADSHHQWPQQAGEQDVSASASSSGAG